MADCKIYETGLDFTLQTNVMFIDTFVVVSFTNYIANVFKRSMESL